MSEKLWILFSSLWPVFSVLVLFYAFTKTKFWEYTHIRKQKSWTPQLLLKGEELRVVRNPYSFPENNIMIIDYGYSHDVATSNKDVVIYWKRSDYFKAKRLYESQIK